MIGDVRRACFAGLSARKKFFYATAEAMIVLTLYLAIGTTVLHYAEGWTIVDGMYFCVVTMSTVGYGDIHPAPGLVWAFNVVLILTGVLLLFPRLSAVISLITKNYVSWGRNKILDWFPNNIGDVSQLKSQIAPDNEQRSKTGVGKLAKASLKGRSLSLRKLRKRLPNSRDNMALKTARRRGSFINKDGVWQEQHALLFFAKNMAPTVFLQVHSPRSSALTHPMTPSLTPPFPPSL